MSETILGTTQHLTPMSYTDQATGQHRLVDRLDPLPVVGAPWRQVLRGYGANIITNGAFAADSDWTKGTGWTIAGGVAVHAAPNVGTALSQNPNTQKSVVPAIKPNTTYLVTYTISTFTSGSLTVSVGGASGTARTAAGTYSELITTEAGLSNLLIAFTADATSDFDGEIDSVTMREKITDGIFKLYPLADTEENIILDLTDGWEGYLDIYFRTLTSSGGTDLDGMAFTGRSGYLFNQLVTAGTYDSTTDVEVSFPKDPGSTNQVTFGSGIDLSVVGAIAPSNGSGYSLHEVYAANGSSVKYFHGGYYVIAGANVAGAADDLGTILVFAGGR